MASGTAIGLDIGTSAVRAAELSFGKRGTTLQRFGQVLLPPGAVRDGEVADPQLVADAIKQLWATAKFKSKKVVVGVGNQRVIVRQVDLPYLPAEELRGSLAFHVQDYLPIPVDQAILDFHPVEEMTAEGGTRMLRVLLVAAARDMVAAVLESVRRAGLSATQVDLTSFAVLRALADSDSLGLDNVDAEALVDVGAKVTNIVVHQRGVPRFVRILLMGGDDLTQAVAERLGVPMEEAERAKREFGLPPANPVAPDLHPGARALEAAVGAFVDEIRGSLDYYLAQPGAVTVRRLVLSGGGAQLPGLDRRLAAATRLPLVAGTALSRLAHGSSAFASDQIAQVEPLMAVPVGLAMGAAA